MRAYWSSYGFGSGDWRDRVEEVGEYIIEVAVGITKFLDDGIIVWLLV